MRNKSKGGTIMWNRLNSKSIEKVLDKIHSFAKKEQEVKKTVDIDEINNLNMYLCKQNEKLLKRVAQ